MAGAVLAGELSTAANQRVRYSLATPADEGALRRLLRETPTEGAISLSFEREPDYFAGAGLGGADDQTIVACEHGRVVCMGRCTLRECWINGARRRVAYLGELRLAAEAQGRFDILRGGYRFFDELQRRAPAEFTFTSIAADNLRARRLLERAVPGLPRYEFLTEFVTCVVSTGSWRSRFVRNGSDMKPDLERGELLSLLDAHAQRHQLAAAWTSEGLGSLARHGLSLDDFVVHRASDGHLLAAAALWDQRAFRQTVVRGYARALAAARPVVNLTARLFGLPPLPAPASVLAHAFLSPLAISPEHLECLPALLASARRRAAERGLAFFTLGFAAGDPRLACVRRHSRGRTYTTRLYRVVWPGERDPLVLDARPVLPEIAFL